MKIAFDLRSLSSGTFSGVENYSVNLLDNLLQTDKQNEYLLFYNSFTKTLPEQGMDFNYINSKIFATTIPSKILNLAFKFNLKKLKILPVNVTGFLCQT